MIDDSWLEYTYFMEIGQPKLSERKKEFCKMVLEGSILPSSYGLNDGLEAFQGVLGSYY